MQPNSPTTVSTALKPTLCQSKVLWHEVLHWLHTSGGILQVALYYLGAIHSKVPDLIQEEKMGEGVQGELDLLGKIVQGDFNAEEWRELSLDLVMADFIHMDAAVDIDSTKVDTMATMKVVDSDDVPQSASQFTSQISSSNLDFTLNRLKSHLVQNLVKKVKVLSGQ